MGCAGLQVNSGSLGMELTGAGGGPEVTCGWVVPAALGLVGWGCAAAGRKTAGQFAIEIKNILHEIAKAHRWRCATTRVPAPTGPAPGRMEVAAHRADNAAW